MEGSNTNIEHEMPASTCPEVSIVNGSLFTLPSSHHGGSHIGAGASSSGIKTCFFQVSDPLSMKDESNNQTNQNLILDTSGGHNSTKIVRGDRNLDHNMDPKMLKRIISNRLSAQKSRNKQAQYISDMEKKVESLESLIAVLSPQVALYGNKKYLLQMEQTNLNQKITTCLNKELIVEAEIEARIEEIKRLKQHLMQQQQQQNLQGQATMDVREHDLTEEMMNPCLNYGTEHTTMDVWEHELVKELMNPCLNSGTEQQTTLDVWEHELIKELMNPCLNSGTGQTMHAAPKQESMHIFSGDAGENEHNENQLHLQQENEH